MRREDYERLGPPPNMHKDYAANFIMADLKEVVLMCKEASGAARKVSTHVGLILEVTGEEGKVMALLDKKSADDVIRGLIACRNVLWPEP